MSTKPSTLSDWLEGARDSELRAALTKALGRPVEVVAVEKQQKPSIRLPRRRKMSAPEQEYGAILRDLFKGATVLYEAITIILPGGSRYSPDWLVTRGREILAIVEVKGRVKLASAARSYTAFKEAIGMLPDWPWSLAEKREGQWVISTPKP